MSQFDYSIYRAFFAEKWLDPRWGPSDGELVTQAERPALLDRDSFLFLLEEGKQEYEVQMDILNGSAS